MGLLDLKLVPVACGQHLASPGTWGHNERHGGSTSLMTTQKLRAEGQGPWLLPAWLGECQEQFGVRNSKGHSREHSADGRMPGSWLMSLAEAVAVWEGPKIVSDPKPSSASPGASSSHSGPTQSLTCHRGQRSGDFSISLKEKGKPAFDLI